MQIEIVLEPINILKVYIFKLKAKSPFDIMRTLNNNAVYTEASDMILSVLILTGSLCHIMSLSSETRARSEKRGRALMSQKNKRMPASQSERLLLLQNVLLSSP